MNFKQSGKKKNECSKCYKLNKKGGCCYLQLINDGMAGTYV